MAEDVDANVVVDPRDALAISGRFNAVIGDPAYCLAADVDDDGKVGIIDLAKLGLSSELGRK